ncbi:MAG: hypothetical protein JWM65_1067 [Sphingomonas bacterium]|jgi:hypothetical protein|nr:hypothetical protein [Sphingomonas bacterium]
MNPFEMVAVIVVAVTIGGVLRARYGAGRDWRGNDVHIAGETNASAAENVRLREELKSLKERLAVLERLATDSNTSSANLDREIEKLRDRS